MPGTFKGTFLRGLVRVFRLASHPITAPQTWNQKMPGTFSGTFLIGKCRFPLFIPRSEQRRNTSHPSARAKSEHSVFQTHGTTALERVTGSRGCAYFPSPSKKQRRVSPRGSPLQRFSAPARRKSACLWENCSALSPASRRSNVGRSKSAFDCGNCAAAFDPSTRWAPTALPAGRQRNRRFATDRKLLKKRPLACVVYLWNTCDPRFLRKSRVRENRRRFRPWRSR
jgi:hypothetical protein